MEEAALAPGEIPYHVILSGSAVLEGVKGQPPLQLVAGDILVLPHGQAHALYDGGDKPALPARKRQRLNLVVSENSGSGERLDMLCGRFIVARPHNRWLHSYLLPRLVVHTAKPKATHTESVSQLAELISLMRFESAADNLAGYAMLNALSTAMFALTLRWASRPIQSD